MAKKLSRMGARFLGLIHGRVLDRNGGSGAEEMDHQASRGGVRSRTRTNDLLLAEEDPYGEGARRP